MMFPQSRILAGATLLCALAFGAIESSGQDDNQGLAALGGSIVRTPFFAISQAQNVGLQLADFVTTIVGLRFAGNKNIQSYFTRLSPAIPGYENSPDGWTLCLKIMKDRS
jgi:hypothetical protein